MSAERLREAAALMREQAEAAAPGPWFVESCGDFGSTTAVIECARWNGGLVNTVNFDNDFPTATHIASWHPAVALAVADWLDEEARWVDSGNEVIPAALAVANAYLGDQR